MLSSREIFLTQGLNPHLLVSCIDRQVLYHQHHLGSPEDMLLAANWVCSCCFGPHHCLEDSFGVSNGNWILLPRWKTQQRLTRLLFPKCADVGATPSQEQLLQVKSSKQKGPLNKKLTTFITRKLGLAAALLFVREGSWGASPKMNCFQRPGLYFRFFRPLPAPLISVILPAVWPVLGPSSLQRS